MDPRVKATMARVPPVSRVSVPAGSARTQQDPPVPRNADSKSGGACAPLCLSDLVRDLIALGVRPGDLLMVHSSLRSIGLVEGGPETVVDALLQALGPDGTLVVPTFTYPTAGDPEFVFDPIHTPSQMGAVSEAARRRPEAHRSIHLAHSIAAIGPLAQTITTSGGDSGWDAHSPMGQVFNRNGRYLLLGVPYQNLTAMHLCEVWLDLPYRKPRISQGRMRQPDGSTTPLVSIGTPPLPGNPGSDYNRLGQRMEDAGLVNLGPVGNAIARLLNAHDFRTAARDLTRHDPNGFLQQGDTVTKLTHGHTIESPKGEHCVVDPTRIYHAT